MKKRIISGRKTAAANKRKRTPGRVQKLKNSYYWVVGRDFGTISQALGVIYNEEKKRYRKIRCIFSKSG